MHSNRFSLHPGAWAQNSSTSATLMARIQEKRAELEHLRELKQLSASMADKMEVLENKLEVLTDGTEGMRSSRVQQLKLIPATINRHC